MFGLKKKKKKEVDFVREEYNRITDEISRLNYELRRDVSRLDELNKALSDLTKLLDKN